MVNLEMQSCNFAWILLMSQHQQNVAKATSRLHSELKSPSKQWTVTFRECHNKY